MLINMIGSKKGSLSGLLKAMVLGLVLALSQQALAKKSKVKNNNVSTQNSVPNTCDLYPITFNQDFIDSLNEGDVLTQQQYGKTRVNWNWLSWSGDQDANTLEASLYAPGDSMTSYVNPFEPDDSDINSTDWVSKANGKMNSFGVRNALQSQLNEVLTVPVWNQSIKHSGGQYRISSFSEIRLLDYRLNPKSKTPHASHQSWLSFEYIGEVNCTDVITNTPPVAIPPISPVTVEEDSDVNITLMATDLDGDPLTFFVSSLPTNGQLRDGDFFGPDVIVDQALSGNMVNFEFFASVAGDTAFFEFYVSDGMDFSDPVRVDILVVP